MSKRKSMTHKEIREVVERSGWMVNQIISREYFKCRVVMIRKDLGDRYFLTARIEDPRCETFLVPIVDLSRFRLDSPNGDILVRGHRPLSSDDVEGETLRSLLGRFFDVFDAEELIKHRLDNVDALREQEEARYLGKLRSLNIELEELGKLRKRCAVAKRNRRMGGQ